MKTWELSGKDPHHFLSKDSRKHQDQKQPENILNIHLNKSGQINEDRIYVSMCCSWIAAIYTLSPSGKSNTQLETKILTHLMGWAYFLNIGAFLP